jgi:hypothetical protein
VQAPHGLHFRGQLPLILAQLGFTTVQLQERLFQLLFGLLALTDVGSRRQSTGSACKISMSDSSMLTGIIAQLTAAPGAHVELTIISHRAAPPRQG